MADGDPQDLSAAQWLQVLNTLERDGRLKDIFGQHPLESLVVAAHDEASPIDVSPTVDLDGEERAIIEAAIKEAFSQAAEPVEAASGRGRRAGAGRAADPNPHIMAARSHLDNGNPGRALQVVEAALPRWPHNVDLHIFHALALAALGRPAQAIEAYREVIRRDPKSAFAHAGAAQLLAELERWDEALAYANSALALDPNDALSLQVLARADERLGLCAEAGEAIRRALEIDPHLPGARQDLRRIERELAEDVEVSLGEATIRTRQVASLPNDADGTSPVPTNDAERAGDEEDIAVELIAGGDEGACEPSPTPPEETTQSGDSRWGAAARHAQPAEGSKCAECGAGNPARVSFCVRCGARLEEGR